MNKNVLVTLVIIAIIVCVGGVAYFVFIQKTNSVTTNNTINTTTTFPAGNSGTVTTTKPPANIGTLSFPTTVNDLSITTNDFRTVSTTIQDTTNKSLYYLSGGINPGNNNAAYSISYNDSDKSFAITIYKEPLGENRKKAETELVAILGITTNDLCFLWPTMTIATGVNSVYEGKDLGVSYCPGSIALP